MPSPAERRIDSIEAARLSVPFKVAFKHASAERREMQSLWVEARSGAFVGVGEGCPREYVTGESLDGAMRFVEERRAGWLASIGGIGSLARHVDQNREEIDANPAAWCAVELALLDVLAQAEGIAVEGLVGVPAVEGMLRYSAVIGDGPPAAFEAQLARYAGAGFRDFKVKLSGDSGRDRAKVAAMRSSGVAETAVRADANNLFRSADEAIGYLRGLAFHFAALEEPLRAGDYEGMRQLARALGTRIVLDESLVRQAQLDQLAADPHVWIANIRVSKMGGLLRSIALARRARDMGLAIIVGAHVGETSVLTRAGITIACLAGKSLVAHEGAFGTHLLARDMVDPPVMFGAGGELDASGRFPAAGWGLAPVAARSA